MCKNLRQSYYIQISYYNRLNIKYWHNNCGNKYQSIMTGSDLMLASDKTSEDKWYKSQRFRIFIHLLAGFCLMATADNSGLSKLISQSLNFTQSADVATPIITMIISGVIIVSGYFLSSRLTSIIDKSTIKEMHKSWIIFSLPAIYFLAVFPLVSIIGALTGTSIIK